MSRRRNETLTTSHLTQHATESRPTTHKYIGQLMADDILRALTRQGKPIVNMWVGMVGGEQAVTKWAMEDAVDV